MNVRNPNVMLGKSVIAESQLYLKDSNLDVCGHDC